MFGTLADFRCADRRGAQAGLEGDVRRGAVAHRRQSSVVQGKPSSRTNPKADWYVWADARPDGTPPTTGCRSSADRRGNGTPAASNIICTTSWTEQPDSTSTTVKSRTRCSTSEPRSGWSAAVDGFRIDTINFYFHSLGPGKQPAAAAGGAATTRRRRRSIPTITRTISTTRADRNLGFLERPRLARRIPGAAAVGEVGDSQRGLEVVAA